MNGNRRFDGRATARAFVELLAMTGLAVAQPLLDVFGRAPEAFTTRDADRGDLVAFALLVTLVPAGRAHGGRRPHPPDRSTGCDVAPPWVRGRRSARSSSSSS